MPHLLKAEAKGLFSGSGVLPSTSKDVGDTKSMSEPYSQLGFAVATDQTPDQERATVSENWRGGQRSTKNLKPRMRGHHY